MLLHETEDALVAEDGRLLRMFEVWPGNNR